MTKNFFIVASVIALLTACAQREEPMIDETGKTNAVVKTDEQWKALLSAEQYRITRKAGTERPFTGQYWNHKELGIYTCVCCGTDLFLSDTKFDASCGWPSYFKPINASAITERRDATLGMVRTEVICSTCGAHLGHVFPDGPPPTGLRYCINSASMSFRAAGTSSSEETETSR